MRLILQLLLFSIVLVSCESAREKERHLQLEEKARIELEAENKRIAEKEEIERLQDEEEKRQRAETERKTQELYNRYINNSLGHGATPYSSCFGVNKSCTTNNCSEIKVNSPNDSDVVVTIKSGDKVERHAYINKGKTYTFQLPNGNYQPFFYYGKGWNPEKEMPSQSCDGLKGGFIEDTQVGKDDPQTLNNDVLT